MACYTFALPAVAVETILMKAFFASRRTVAVSILGIVFSTLSMFISWGGSRLFRENELLVLGIIAGGFALTRWMKTASLVVLFRRSAPAFPAAETASFLARLALASAFIAGAAHVGRMPGRWLGHIPPPPHGASIPEWLTDLVQLGLGGLAALVTLVAAFALLRIREPLDLVRAIRSRGKGRSSRVPPSSNPS
jgi:peptidoglycan biosynthesis protein MviN/MurJ (putative lipid II flippase)